MRVDFELVCPECRTPLVVGDPLRCPTGGHVYPVRDGIPRLLGDARFERYRRFLDEYRTVRRAEGRGVADAAAYRGLPDHDASGGHRAEWRVRAATFAALVDEVVTPLAAARTPLTIADLGAGTTWMSRRLALAGHRVVAVDLDTDPADGLGARRFSEVDFDAVQAEFDRLPIPDDGCDLAVFNGSLHYSADPAATLAEALRVLRPGGAVAVLDTPFYRSASAGLEMVADRQADFEARFGFASASIDSRGFLTFDELEELAGRLGVEWRVDRPFLGLRWALRPLIATVRRRREPATFALVWATT